jgi:ribonuclease HI
VKSGYGVVGSGAGMTNNIVEYSALKHAAEWVRQQGGDDKIIVKGDFPLVKHQLNGTWQITSETSKKFVPGIRRLLEGKKTHYTRIPGEENAEADRLSNLAYNQQSREPTDSDE